MSTGRDLVCVQTHRQYASKDCACIACLLRVRSVRLAACHLHRSNSCWRVSLTASQHTKS